MATVNRPPFWVPRPQEDHLWFAAPQRSHVFTLATTQKSFFGAPGQVPTRRWQALYTDNDPPPWYPLPASLQATDTLSLLPRPPQATFQFDLCFPRTYDETASWYPTLETLNSLTLFLPTPSPPRATTEYRRALPFTYDETAPWYPSASSLQATDILTLLAQPARATFQFDLCFPRTYDETAPWYPSASSLQATDILTLLAQPARATFQFDLCFPRTYDETAPWSPSASSLQACDLLLLLSAPATPPFSTTQFHLMFPRLYDETSSWSAAPIGVNQNLAAVTYVPRAPLYALRPGEDALWTGVPTGVGIVRMPVATKPFFVSWQASRSYDETAPWQPLSANMETTNLLLLLATQPPRATFQFDITYPRSYDETSTIWQGRPLVSNPNFFPAASPPRATFQYDLFFSRTYDETPIWQWAPPTASITCASFVLYPPRNEWAAFLRSTEEYLWSGSPTAPNTNLLQSSVSPPRATFQYDLFFPRSYDETAPWYPLPANLQATDTLSLLPRLPQATFQFDLCFPRTYDETAPWYPSARSLSATELLLLLATQPPHGTFQYNLFYPRTYDETSTLWQGRPLVSNPNFFPTASPPRATFQYDLFFPRTIDETASWPAQPVSSNPNFLPATTQVPRAPLYALRPGEDAVWIGMPRVSNQNLFPSVSPPRSTFQYDLFFPRIYDEIIWTGTPKGVSPSRIPPPTPFPTSPWRFAHTYDETPIWQWTPPTATLTCSSFVLYPPRNEWAAWLRPVEEFPWVGQPVASNPHLYTPLNLVQIPRAPFYAIRPAEDFLWNWLPHVTSRGLLVPVQSPLIRPIPSFYSEYSLWQGTPTPSKVFSLATTQKSFFGAPGQVPTRRWQTLYTFNDPPMWQGAPTPAYVITLLITQQKMYGQPGQVVPRFYKFDFDEQASWPALWPTMRQNALLYVFVTPRPPANVVQAKVRVTVSYSRTVVSSVTAVTAVSTAETKFTVS